MNKLSNKELNKITKAMNKQFKAINEPKQKKNEKKELTQEEFIEKLITDKLELYYKKEDEINQLEKLIDSLKSKTNIELILEERRDIINKALNKIKKADQKKQDELKEKLKKEISYFDNNYNITQDKLINFNLNF